MTYSQRTIGSRHVYQRKFCIGHAFEKTSSEDVAEFTTRCSSMSSSWRIVLVLRRDSPLNELKIQVNLLRIDNGELCLKADLHIWLMNADGKKCPEMHQLKCKLKSQKMETKILNLDNHSTCSYKCLYQKDRVTFPKDVLVVKYTFKVSGCHNFGIRDMGEGRISSGSEGMNRMILSKL